MYVLALSPFVNACVHLVSSAHLLWDSQQLTLLMSPVVVEWTRLRIQRAIRKKVRQSLHARQRVWVLGQALLPCDQLLCKQEEI